MTWFKRESSELDATGEKRVRTEGLWEKCEGCRQIIWKKDLDANLNVCPKCQKHFRLDARTRLSLLLDNSEWEETETNLGSTDPLDRTHLAKVKRLVDRLALALLEGELSEGDRVSVDVGKPAKDGDGAAELVFRTERQGAGPRGEEDARVEGEAVAAG